MRNPNQETWESFSEFLSSKGLMTDQRKGVEAPSVSPVISLQNNCSGMPRIWTKPSPEPPSTGACLSSLKVESSVKSTLVRQQVLRLERSIRNLQSPCHLFGLQPHRGYRRPFHGMVRQTVSELLGMKVKDQLLQVHAECPDFRKSEMLEIKQSMIATSKESLPPNLPS